MPTLDEFLNGPNGWTQTELDVLASMASTTTPGYKYSVKTREPRSTQEEEEMSPIAAREGFTFGCDPELFVLNAEGKPVSAHGLIPGDKAGPYPVEYGAVQVDGMAAEFNIEPVTTFKEWNRNIDAVLRQLKEMLPSGYSLTAVPSIVFDQDVFDATPDEAKELGCHPDHDAWTGEVNPPPSTSKNPYLRTAAGHIHFGWTNGAAMDDAQHILNCRDLVKQLDWYLGAWSLKMDKDPVRRSLYGRAGACRYKHYGVEYRVLSNFWVESESRRKIIWNRMNKAIHDMTSNFYPQGAGGYNDILRQSIDTSVLDKTLSSQYRYPVLSIAA